MLLFSFALMPFTILSIIAATKYKKLPRERKEKPRWIAAGILCVHPYVTTAVLVVINALVGAYGIYLMVS